MDEIFVAFTGDIRLAIGDLAAVTRAVHDAAAGGAANLSVFGDETGRPVDLDLRGSVDDALARLPSLAATPVQSPPPRGPGRPRLGVVAREVTLLPRHWAWLAEQPGGASVALRRLVEAARKTEDGPAQRKAAQEAAYRFMSALSGDRPGFEEAARALFAGQADRFSSLIAPWPADIRTHTQRLAARVWDDANSGAPEPGGQAA